MPKGDVKVKAVEEALAKDERTKGLHLHVRVIGEAVFLEGEVETEDQRAAAEEVAKQAEGIRWVRNHLQVDPAGRQGGWRDRLRHPG